MKGNGGKRSAKGGMGGAGREELEAAPPFSLGPGRVALALGRGDEEWGDEFPFPPANGNPWVGYGPGWG